jgi:hydroxypyruvate reductase
MSINPEEFLKEMFFETLKSVKGNEKLAKLLPEPPRGKTLVLGAGKGAASMAKTVEENWEGDISGLVVTRYGHKIETSKIEVVEAAHPNPDKEGKKAAERIIKMAEGLGKDDLLICLISGGGSALLSLPAKGIPLEDKRRINSQLLKSGANIAEINSVRKHLSAIKGGRLAEAAYPARVISYLISDVPGDDPSVIASGPTVADPTTYADALRVLKKYSITPPKSVLQRLEKAEDETPKEGSKFLDKSVLVMLATPQDALDTAAEFAKSKGINSIILGNAIEGEAKDVAKVHAGIVKQIISEGQPIKKPCVILSGGETTVTVRGNGRGGRNVEFALGLTLALKGTDNVYAISCDTDGIDGMEDHAGAFISPDTLKRATEKGLDAAEHLSNNDAYTFFEKLHNLIITGPTLTNVNDFRAILIL